MTSYTLLTTLGPEMQKANNKTNVTEIPFNFTYISFASQITHTLFDQHT